MKCPPFLLATAAMLALYPTTSRAQDRYAERPPVVLSPDLSAPWVMQLRVPAEPVRRIKRLKGQRMVVIGAGTGVGIATQVAPDTRPLRKLRNHNGVFTVPAAADLAPKRAPRPQMDERFLPQTVSYDGQESPGTIVIDTADRFLYLVQGNGKAKRYGVGVGKEGHGWSGTETISRKREWPDWRPPAEMIERVKNEEGRTLPEFMEGGPDNPLGARAMYLGATLYRIHGTNQPWTIGTAVSSGCIRMRNEDVIDLYSRVKIGTKVIVR
jgi:lipoprotein-anchoring transpeptidase ErfK/SrfK